MSLRSNVEDRYSDQYLINLTNPQNPSATTVNTALLILAATDVQGAFETYAQVVYDDTEAQHVEIGVSMVIAKLKMYSGQGGGDALAEHDRSIERLKDLSRVTSRARVTPRSKSELVPTNEQIGTETVRPLTDGRRFNDIIPSAPPANDDP